MGKVKEIPGEFCPSALPGRVVKSPHSSEQDTDPLEWSLQFRAVLSLEKKNWSLPIEETFQFSPVKNQIVEVMVLQEEEWTFSLWLPSANKGHHLLPSDRDPQTSFSLGVGKQWDGRKCPLCKEQHRMDKVSYPKKPSWRTFPVSPATAEQGNDLPWYR